jgi:2-iminobutanoate/2-iminopropanoate deaminase
VENSSYGYFDLKSTLGALRHHSGDEKMSISYTRSNPDSLPTVKRGGLTMLAQVVTVEGAHKYVFLSGQLARDANGNCVGAGDMRAQMIQVYENVITGLKEAGATFANVVKSNTYVTNMAEYVQHADLRAKYICNPPAASTTIEVKSLILPEFLIEVDVIAMV